MEFDVSLYTFLRQCKLSFIYHTATGVLIVKFPRATVIVSEESNVSLQTLAAVMEKT
jgi:hypothetical protein